MKKLLLLLLFPLFVNAQYLALNGIDEFTGDRIIKVNCTKSKTWKQSDKISSGMLNYVFLSSRYVQPKNSDSGVYYTNFNIHNLGPACLSEYDGKAIFLFEDASTIEAKQFSRTDCKNSPIDGSYLLSEEETKLLASKPLSKFRIYTTDGYVDYEVKKDKKDLIMKHYALLLSTPK